MIFPLEELIEYDKNMYEITAASSRRSYQLSILYSANDERFFATDRFGGIAYLGVTETVTLRHEEHAPIDLPAGPYKVTRQREYDPHGSRYVAD